MILDIDDGSGDLIEVKLIASKASQELNRRDESALTLKDDNESLDDSSARVPEDALRTSAGSRANKSKPQQSIINTNVENINVTNYCSDRDCHEWHPRIDGTVIDIGTVLKAKGTITSYNDVYQVQLERAFLIQTTDEELRVWDDYTSFVNKTLSKPWVLDKPKLRELEREHRQTARKAEVERERRRQEDQRREQRRCEKREMMRKREEREEMARQAERVELDGNALDRPNWKPWPEVVRKMRRRKPE